MLLLQLVLFCASSYCFQIVEINDASSPSENQLAWLSCMLAVRSSFDGWKLMNCCNTLRAYQSRNKCYARLKV